MQDSLFPCAKCGHRNDSTAPLCGGCYADLRTSICPHCGAKHLPAAQACPRCRRSVGATPGIAARSMEVAEVEGDPRFDLFYGIGFVLYVGALAIACVFAYQTPPDLTMATLFAVLGAGLGPVLFTVFLWFGWANRLMPGWAPLLAGVCGAGIGVVFAAILHLAIPVIGLGFGSVLALPVIVGAAEELGKALSLGLFFKTKQYHPERCGLVLGMLAGLGFAGSENVGYMVQTLAQKGPAELVPLMGIRAGTSLAHAMWTGILCSVAWRERRGTLQYGKPLLNAYLAVSLLHALWDFGLVATHSSEVLAAILVSALCTLALWLLRMRAAFGTRD